MPLQLVHEDSGEFVSHFRECLVGKAEWQSRSKRRMRQMLLLLTTLGE